ncbi:MAG: TAXI family TRAP transporter solute-binding subunit [Desulfobacteraceae bacterium]|nr:MAG: TAXI family TRAP transporter solute-binding subunit [Desulfobacteraceae bacterium]
MVGNEILPKLVRVFAVTTLMRRRKMKKIVALLVCMFLWSCLSTQAGYAKDEKKADWPKHISWSSPSGPKWTTAVGFTALIQKYTGVSSSALGPSGGTMADIQSLVSKNAEIAWNSNPSVHEAWIGGGAYKKMGPQKWIRALSGGYEAFWLIIARGNSDIKSFKDIKGHRWGGDVMIGSDLTDQTRDGLLKIHGMTKRDYKSFPITKFAELVDMMKEGRVDVVAFFAGTPSPYAIELATAMDLTWISLEPEAAKKVPETLYGHQAGIIRAGSYKGQTKDVIAAAHMTIPIVHEDLHEDVVYGIMKALFDHPDEMEAIHPSAKDFARKPATLQVTAPYHRGAVRYYKEKGLWTAELENLQKKILGQ